jgi:Zn-dependent protease
LATFLENFDMAQLISVLLRVAASLLCITFHELSHGYVAYRLGDPTAKQMGRLTLNPLKHIDPWGLLLMITARVGWAKPVPVDMRYFKHPKRDMAITALAGPVSNFLMALIALAIASLMWALWDLIGSTAAYYVLLFAIQVAVLNMGLGIFNLIPVSPLDGSKILFSFLPDKWYYTILRYERYVMILVIVLVWLGVFDRPLSFLIYGGLRVACTLTRFPFDLLLYLL